MSWHREWKSLAARIQALLEVGKFFYLTGGVDEAGVAKAALVPSAEEVFEHLKAFRDRHGTVLPDEAKPVLDRLIDQWTRACDGQHGAKPGGYAGVQFFFPLLGTFRSEFEHAVADTEAIGRSLTERAFLHLQRSIVADPDVAARWQRAFGEGELACEKLGSQHLLLHGIWAFKANTAGERTDLVLGTALTVTERVRQAAEAMVLTEWKVVAAPGECRRVAAAAVEQARRYAGGGLAGFELATRRYIVLLSEDHLEELPDVTHDVVCYRHIDIAVRPSPPSGARRPTTG